MKQAVKKYIWPITMLALFETIAITLWQAKDNTFYLLNFSYIGCSIALGMFLFINGHRHARRIVQLLVGLYMLIYLGLICGENMQIEGSGIICLPVCLKRQRFIMLLQRFSVR